MDNDLYQQIYLLVKKIPQGRVATYGQIAAALGKPQGSRLVGWALSVCPNDVPWHRVINRKGMISITNRNLSKQEQANLLTQEGITVTEKAGNFWVDLDKHLWLGNL
ncbi:MGMT family protein [Patescibacteria group bacterium]|nr:MGMT family protein [Patescibacteria group bacterium]